MRYFARVVELGSMGRAAAELGVGTSALSQQISRLEGQLATRLLTRTASGVVPTEAGLAFLHQAQLALRPADDAVRAARSARLSGHVSVGLGATVGNLVGVTFIRAMRERYPEVRLKLVESLSGNLTTMLGTRQLDLRIAYGGVPAERGTVIPLLEERLFAIGAPQLPGMPRGPRATLADLAGVPLIMPSARHDLRGQVDVAFARAGIVPEIVLEIDGFLMMTEAVRAGMGATIQPGAATACLADGKLAAVELDDPDLARRVLITSLAEDEMSPAGLAARLVLAEVIRATVARGAWPGARLLAPDCRA